MLSVWQNIYIYSLCVNDGVKYYSFLGERGREISRNRLTVSHSITVFSRGCQPHLPLSDALFLCQRGFTCLLLVSPRAPTSPNGGGGNKNKNRNSISFVFQKLRVNSWLCYTWHNAPRTGPKSPRISFCILYRRWVHLIPRCSFLLRKRYVVSNPLL